jgi:hypothetical protein
MPHSGLRVAHLVFVPHAATRVMGRLQLARLLKRVLRDVALTPSTAPESHTGSGHNSLTYGSPNLQVSTTNGLGAGLSGFHPWASDTILSILPRKSILEVLGWRTEAAAQASSGPQERAEMGLPASGRTSSFLEVPLWTYLRIFT